MKMGDRVMDTAAESIQEAPEEIVFAGLRLGDPGFFGLPVS